MGARIARIVAAVLVVTTAPVLAQTSSSLPRVLPAPPAAEMHKTAGALLAVEHHWTSAEVHGDALYVAALLLPEYRSVGADGVAHPRSAIVASSVRNGKSDTMARTVATYMKLHPYGTSVLLQGDTGIVTFYSLKLGLARGVMSSDIFVWSVDRWHAIYSQHTAVKP